MRYSKLMMVALTAVLAGSITTTGCKKKSGCTDSKASNYDPTAEKDDGTCKTDAHSATKQAIKENYAAIVYASYKDAHEKAVKLQTAVNAFLADKNIVTYIRCKDIWKEAREPYGQTEAYRFASGPIDAADGPEGMLNAWPLDENYIDYVRGNANAGIINNPTTYPTIDKALLESLNEKGGEANISAGYHAIEFLLWGQDSEDVTNKMPGQRDYTDYLESTSSVKNHVRRGQYLKAAVDLLVDNLGTMVDAWDPNKSGNYRAQFIALDNNTALKNILTGIGTLSKSELAGERMFVALDNKDQEDEHSCFSDNTHRDIILNAQGIRNVYRGVYTASNGAETSGKSIRDLIMAINPALGAEMDALSDEVKTNTASIPVPFDYALTQESTGGNGPIMKSVNSLKKQGDKIAEIATALGITINTELPE